MSIRIETLTDEQRAKFPEYAGRWTRIGLSTEPADRPRAERAIVAMYAAAKLPAPRIVWCSSPLSNALTRAIVLNLETLAEPGCYQTIYQRALDQDEREMREQD